MLPASSGHEGRSEHEHLVPLVDFGVQVGFVEVLGEAGVCAHPASEAQVARVLDGGLGGRVEAVLCVCAVARLELLGCNADLAALHIVENGRAVHRT